MKKALCSHFVVHAIASEIGIFYIIRSIIDDCSHITLKQNRYVILAAIDISDLGFQKTKCVHELFEVISVAIDYICRFIIFVLIFDQFH